MNSPHQPWAKDSVSIHLSKSRRGKLADYATGGGKKMTPAEAIYALIDTASGQDIEESMTLSDMKIELMALRHHMNDQEKIIQECTQALHAVAHSFETIQTLIQRLKSSDTF